MEYDASTSRLYGLIMKVLVTGASGLLGSALLRAASQSGTTAIAGYNSHPLNGGLQMDVTEQSQVQAAIQR
ncbi:MAG: NAD-dependent epimerase/dehydratase family protein, partial [Halobacteriota archaeon]